MSEQVPQGSGQGLHPVSIVFNLVEVFRHFLTTVLALILVGAQAGLWLWIAIIALPLLALLVLYAVLHTLRYRYWIEPDAILIRSGVFERTVRRVPYLRIQNVNLKQTLLQRLLGVTELRLESASGGSSEAEMRVLDLDRALELERLVRARRGGVGTTAEPAPAAVAEWYRASPGELARLGLIDNRAWVIIAGILGLLFELLPDYLGPAPEVEYAARWWGQQLGGGVIDSSMAIIGVVLFAIAFLIVLAALSILATWVRFWDFRLLASDGRLITERGLFTRIRGSARPERLEALVVSENPLFLLFDRRALGAAVVGALNLEPGEPPLRWLAPVLTPLAVGELVQRVQPSFCAARLRWFPVHASAFRRVLAINTVLAAIVTVSATLLFGWWGLTAWLLVLAGIWHARRYADGAAVGISGSHVVLRGGVLDAGSTLIPRARIHALEVRQSPFDRRHGTATLLIDLIVPVPRPGRVHLPYLPVEVAHAIAGQLRRPPWHAPAPPARTPATPSRLPAEPARADRAPGYGMEPSASEHRRKLSTNR